jgi:SAM-dependent methyltransferase
VLAARHRRVVGVDAYRASLTRARSLVAAVTLIEGDVCGLPLGDKQFDVAVALDVLEHVAPAPFLAEARRLVRRMGWLLLSVPASPALWSGLDEVAGHRCRYRRRDLERELTESGWRLAHWTHYQALLYPAVWLSRRIEGQRRTPLERRPPRALGRVLGAVNDLEVSLFERRRLPFGTSLVALAQRTD